MAIFNSIFLWIYSFVIQPLFVHQTLFYYDAKPKSNQQVFYARRGATAIGGLP